jgi:hypothetical protein
MRASISPGIYAGVMINNPTVEIRLRGFSLSRLEPWRSRVVLRNSSSFLLE